MGNIIVAKSNIFMSPEDREKTYKELNEQAKTGVMLLPPYVQFCCVVGADGVVLAHDGLYPCDPDKAERCPKTSCWTRGGDCHMTTNEKWRLTI